MDPLLEAAKRLAKKKARRTGAELPARSAPADRRPPPPVPSPSPAPELAVAGEEPPRNWRVLVRGRWPVPYEEEWEERSAIMTFEGRLPKDVAERKAYEDMVARHEVLQVFERELRSHEEDPRIRLFRGLFEPRLMAVWWSES